MLTITPTTIFNDKNIEITEDDLMFYLTENVTFENDVTFERVFNLILKHDQFLDIVFYRSLGGFKVADFFEDFIKEPTENDFNDFEDPEILELTWITDIYEDKISFNVDLAAKTINNVEDVSYSLSFSSLSTYKHLMIKINTNFSIYSEPLTNVPLLTCQRHMTLYDVIKSILTEITFYGSPYSRSVIHKEIVKITNDLELDASIHMLSFDDLFKNIKDDLDPNINIR